MKISIYLLLAGCILTSCNADDLGFPTYTYECWTAPPDSSTVHPRNAQYRELLTRLHQDQRMLGATLLVRDSFGLWMGASGPADLTSMTAVEPCHRFPIASVSKVYTSAVVFRLNDRGLLHLDDPICDYLDDEITQEVANADVATIRQLLSHTSGVPDIYTISFELDRVNEPRQGWSTREVLTYTYGKAATHQAGTTYNYCNTNFLLLGLIAESASGDKSLEQLYREEVFVPLGLASAYYNESAPIPPGTVQGHVDLYGDDSFTLSDFLYLDELGVGGDGGVVSNAYDVERFFEQLLRPGYLSPESRDALTDWFELPAEFLEDDSNVAQRYNGIGIERFETSYGYAVGHSGGIDGYISLALHFPETGYSFVLLQNLADTDDRITPVLDEVLPIMFQ